MLAQCVGIIVSGEILAHLALITDQIVQWGTFLMYSVNRMSESQLTFGLRSYVRMIQQEDELIGLQAPLELTEQLSIALQKAYLCLSLARTCIQYLGFGKLLLS